MKQKSVLSKLMEYAGSYKSLTYISWVLSAVSSALALFPFYYIWKIIKEILEVAPDFSKATNVVHNGWMSVIMALMAIVVYIVALLCAHLSAFRITKNLRVTLLEHIMKLPIGAIDEMGSGRVRKIVNDSSAAAEHYLSHQLPDVAGSYSTVVGMFVFLFVVDWRFGLVSMIPIVLAFLSMGKMMGPQMVEDMKQHKNALEDMNNEAVEYVRGVSVVKTFGQTIHSFKKFKDSIDRYYKFCVSYTKSCRIPMVLFTVAINSGFVFLIFAGILMAHGEPMSMDLMLNVMFYIIFTPVVTTTFNKIMYTSENTIMVKDAMERIDSLLNLSPLAEMNSYKKPADSSISFEHVSFKYAGASNDAIKDLNLEIKSGQTIALVGPSGGGKSTTASLISRFFDVTEGCVKIGGVDVRYFEKKDLMNYVSNVFQNSHLLKTSIFENVRMGKKDATRDEVLEALHKAQCDDIIEKFEDGIDTVIGAKGVYVSGGECQRIAIARAMLKNSPIIVLDEATAFADPENEYLVQKAFAELAKDKTVIMIAHRLSTIKNVDKIFVIKDGSIAESGNHQELLNKNGVYAGMWKEYQMSASWKVGESA